MLIGFHEGYGEALYIQATQAVSPCSLVMQANIPVSSIEALHDSMAVASRGGGVNALHCYAWEDILTISRQYVQDLHRPCVSLNCSSAVYAFFSDR